MTLPLLLAACSPPAPDVAAYRAALVSGECATVDDDPLRDDCWLAHLDPADADFCDRFTTEKLRDECAFTMGERTGDATWCGRAGAFATDCRLHLVSQRFAGLGAGPGEREAEVEAIIVGAGLAADDPRPWSAWYRQALGASMPLDRARCDAVADEERREACRFAGLALYHDRLNNARDRRTYPCDGAELPPFLQYAPDPELDRARQLRRPDLCRR